MYTYLFSFKGREFPFSIRGRNPFGSPLKSPWRVICFKNMYSFLYEQRTAFPKFQRTSNWPLTYLSFAHKIRFYTYSMNDESNSRIFMLVVLLTIVSKSTFFNFAINRHKPFLCYLTMSLLRDACRLRKTNFAPLFNDNYNIRILSY